MTSHFTTLFFKKFGFSNKVLYIPLYYIDSDFSTDDKCKPNPCANDGNCTRADNPQGFTCNCTLEYTGDICEIKIGEKNNSAPSRILSLFISIQTYISYTSQNVILSVKMLPSKRSQNNDLDRTYEASNIDNNLINAQHWS